jgi:hypothetical protein
VLAHDRLIRVNDFAARTGWEVQPEGLCRGAVCVPLPPSALTDDKLDLSHVAESLRMPLVHEPAARLWALGPPASRRVLESSAGAAPDLVLPDVDGKPFALRSLRGKKVLLLAWASW